MEERERLSPGGKDIGKDDRDIDSELEYSDAKLVQAAAGLEQNSALLLAALRQRYSRCRSPRSSCSFAWSESLAT